MCLLYYIILNHPYVYISLVIGLRPENQRVAPGICTAAVEFGRYISHTHTHTGIKHRYIICGNVYSCICTTVILAAFLIAFFFNLLRARLYRIFISIPTKHIYLYIYILYNIYICIHIMFLIRYCYCNASYMFVYC
jgi:hypothetical protein